MVGCAPGGGRCDNCPENQKLFDPNFEYHESTDPHNLFDACWLWHEAQCSHDSDPERGLPTALSFEGGKQFKEWFDGHSGHSLGSSNGITDFQHNFV